MAKTMGLPAVLVLAMLAVLTGARPQSQRDVKLITEPRPGQEYVMIQSSVFQPRQFTGQPERDFVTSHKIPGKLPVDDPEDLVVKPSKTKIKRESSDDDTPLPEEDGVAFLLTPDQTLALAPSAKKTEVRTEFSVVTSKPRKEAKERAFSQTPKASSAAKAPTTAPQLPQPEVNVETKGNTGKLEATLTGADEKKVMVKKLTAADHVTKEVVKEEQTLKEVEVKPASEAGVSSPQVETEEGAITVPLQKKQATSAPQDVVTTYAPTLTTPATTGEFELLPVNILPKTAEKNKEKDFDFVDTPLADKVLVPAGSNQQSRIEVKKGPNGQDYEYEYVYYYYDDDENDAAGGTGAKKTVVKGSTTTTAEPTTTSRHYLPKKEKEPEVTPSEKDADQTTRTRGRTRGQTAAVATEEKHDDKAAGKTRYTSIDRVTSPAPDTANEIIPARGASTRTRGRTLTTEDPTTVEERLPANTRFPPRSRSNHNSNSIAATTPIPQETSTTRGRGSGGANSVRRPSLELVDSSSFKTQSSDASRDQDPRPEFPKALPAANEEDEAPRPRGRTRAQSTTPAAPVEASEEDTEIPDSHSRGQLSRRPDAAIRSRGQVESDEEEEEDEIVTVPQSVTSAPEDTQALTTVTDVDIGLTAAAMDKAALELYAVLSQARAESNSVDEELAGEELTTELEDISTTLEPTTEAPTTTTTTTTPAPTTTTTTTTETPVAAGRGRYRQRGNTGSGAGGRPRFRGGESSTTTTEAPVETSTKGRARFGSNRVTSGGSFGRRGGFGKSTTVKPDEEAAHEHEATKEEAKSDAAAPSAKPSGFSRNRFSATRPSRVTTPSSAEVSSDDSHTAHSSSAPAKPVFADRFNLRRRGGLKPASTAAPAAEETKSEASGEDNNEPTAAVETSTAAAGVRVPGRSRLSVGSGPRPLRPGPRVNIAPRGRLGAATTTTTVAPSTEAEEAVNEQASASQEETQPEEAQEAVTTPVPDALTRLRNRPRLRVSAAKPTQAPAAAPIRRPLMPRRKLGQAAEVKESAETESQDSTSAEEAPSSSEDASEANAEEASSPATVEPEQPHGLASLVSGRRRGNALRRPRTLLLGGTRVTSPPS